MHSTSSDLRVTATEPQGQIPDETNTFCRNMKGIKVQEDAVKG